MDRALKERIIGAVVLVLVMVLVVPVFLDGPPEGNGIVSEHVPLPGQAEQDTRTIVLDRDRETPVPAPRPGEETAAEDSPGAAAQQAGEAETKAVAPRPAPEPVPPPAVEAADAPAGKSAGAGAVPAGGQTVSATGMWAVQLGSFGARENAERLAAGLRKQGFAAFLSQLATENGTLHRVRVGPQKDRDSAEAMAGRLAAAGYDGQVVPHP